MSARATSTSRTKQEFQAAILKLFLTARNEADAAAKARPETPTSGWITVEEDDEDERVTATFGSELKRVVVRDLCPNRWKDYDIRQLELYVHVKGDWTRLSSRDRVPWSAEEALPVRIKPRTEDPLPVARGNPCVLFRGQLYARLPLQDLISDSTRVKPEHMESIPAASNYLIEIDFGPQGECVRSIIDVFEHFSRSRTSLGNHATCLDGSSDCALLVDPSWLREE
eukprot:m.94849 g.94849  ORF g.94849 m.94849 type:complete len:226 (-) comp51270_c0_seq4:72-749(-)